uniref:Ribonuclease H protein At1g65750 family n=1 Tax=Cajanus cajan TaxID=3821 RepID=A0A151QYX2_CAJCA|nr:Putative ribonuclease H protein At1g65750 family [Cajanus cajan]
MGKDKVPVDILQYADDTLIMGHASHSNIWTIKSILRLFELASGLKVNFSKSTLMGYNVESQQLQIMASILHCRVGSTPFSYLGLPIGANHRMISTWHPVIEKVKKRLSRWKCTTLSFGGRIALLKSVLHSIPIYFLSFFKAPKGIISSIESLFKSFLWGADQDNRKINWVAWDVVCRDKIHGGLGIKDLTAFNLALLGKCGAKGSRWWVDLNRIEEGDLVCNKWMSSKCCKVIGNGVDTKFWLDKWVGHGSLAHRFSRLYQIEINKNASIAEMFEWEGVWLNGSGAGEEDYWSGSSNS